MQSPESQIEVEDDCLGNMKTFTPYLKQIRIRVEPVDRDVRVCEDSGFWRKSALSLFCFHILL